MIDVSDCSGCEAACLTVFAASYVCYAIPIWCEANRLVATLQESSSWNHTVETWWSSKRVCSDLLLHEDQWCIFCRPLMRPLKDMQWAVAWVIRQRVETDSIIPCIVLKKACVANESQWCADMRRILANDLGEATQCSHSMNTYNCDMYSEKRYITFAKLNDDRCSVVRIVWRMLWCTVSG